MCLGSSPIVVGKDSSPLASRECKIMVLPRHIEPRSFLTASCHCTLSLGLLITSVSLTLLYLDSGGELYFPTVHLLLLFLDFREEPVLNWVWSQNFWQKGDLVINKDYISQNRSLKPILEFLNNKPKYGNMYFWGCSQGATVTRLKTYIHSFFK